MKEKLLETKDLIGQFNSGDVVRVKKGLPGKTGVVNRVCYDTESVNVFITYDNPSGIGVWYNYKELKKIGSTNRKKNKEKYETFRLK